MGRASYDDVVSVDVNARRVRIALANVSGDECSHARTAPRVAWAIGCSNLFGRLRTQRIVDRMPGGDDPSTKSIGRW